MGGKNRKCTEASLGQFLERSRSTARRRRGSKKRELDKRYSEAQGGESARKMRPTAPKEKHRGTMSYLRESGGGVGTPTAHSTTCGIGARPCPWGIKPVKGRKGTRGRARVPWKDSETDNPTFRNSKKKVPGETGMKGSAMVAL